MSIFSTETIQFITDSAGVNVRPEIATRLLADAEYRLREIICEAAKFMNHGKRRKLTTEDINQALRVRNVEALYGFGPGTNSKFRSTSTAQKLFYAADHEVDLEEVIAAPLPPVPLHVAYTGHWLAINGVQPSIVQNPTPAELKAASLKTTGVITKPEPNGTTTVENAPTIKQSLSRELQVYFEKVTEFLLGDDQKLRQVATTGIAEDPGLQALIPYFVEFIEETVTKNLRKLDVLWSMMRLMRALFTNPNLFVEPYLHKMIPIVMTCLVGKRLSEHPTENHWALRDYSAALLSHICITYSTTYATIQPRITKTLLRTYLEALKPRQSHYGAIVGLGKLGQETVKVVIIPHVNVFGDLVLQPDLNEAAGIKKDEAQKCFDALKTLLTEHARQALRDEKLTNPRASPSAPAYAALYGIWAQDVYAAVQNQ
ncbi:hypothetical protein SmJEL517_g03787 [Synchytrium microbalum]|uniref:TATA box binding protein associated factor (TAF) histone-like fold domain-containing protein n=1 Tax=Synchytrium microbalum TaxID=1806994 RepID=A0A507C5H7_9FUNG|nr:uncharacterized protein SmJEL517_g03787 [Synchytrium microbalum]TPX33354.1 hypothetical protein SmJEL517_g03787 [Synchytrium microbalum]